MFMFENWDWKKSSNYKFNLDEWDPEKLTDSSGLFKPKHPPTPNHTDNQTIVQHAASHGLKNHNST